MEMTSYPDGVFCFPELNTDAMDASKRFYGELLGWSAFDVPSAQGGYALMRVGGKDAAGLHRSARGAPCWLSYVNVESADATAARAAELGATDAVAPFDVPGIGRMAMFRDPCGATLALWQAAGHTGARIVGEPGAMCWNELLVKDVEPARRFYGALFGWEMQETTVPAGPYTMLRKGERQVGAMMPIQPSWGDVPPHWQVYFAVKDCAGSSARASSLGGALLAGPMEVPGVGRFSILKDPAGATFAIFE